MAVHGYTLFFFCGAYCAGQWRQRSGDGWNLCLGESAKNGFACVSAPLFDLKFVAVLTFSEIQMIAKIGAVKVAYAQPNQPDRV